MSGGRLLAIATTALGIMLTSGCGGGTGDLDVAVTQEDWQYQHTPGVHLTTEHFDVYTTTEDQELRSYLPGFLEATYRQYADLLPPPPGEHPRLQTYLFANQRQWDSFVRRNFPQRYDVYARIQVGGFAEGGTCVAYNVQPRSYTLSVIANEGMHQYFGVHFEQRIPAWLNEGMACYCEGFDFRRGRPVFTPQRNTVRLNPLREALAGDTLLPLPELLATDAGQVIIQSRSRAVRTYYAQAWALIVYLRHGADGGYAERFEAMMADVAAGQLGRRARAARLTAPDPGAVHFGESVFRAYIDEDLDAFDERFRAFMAKLAFGR